MGELNASAVVHDINRLLAERDAALARIETLRDENLHLWQLVEDVALAGVEEHDPRKGYALVRIPSDTWREAFEAASRKPDVAEGVPRPTLGCERSGASGPGCRRLGGWGWAGRSLDAQTLRPCTPRSSRSSSPQGRKCDLDGFPSGSGWAGRSRLLTALPTDLLLDMVVERDGPGALVDHAIRRRDLMHSGWAPRGVHLYRRSVAQEAT